MTTRQLVLFDDPADLPATALLASRHYLGRESRRQLGYADDDGVMTFASPTSRFLPSSWLELTRWCVTGGPNAGSRQWAKARRFLMRERTDLTTVVSYSDPSVGHTGALYRACGWLWAPSLKFLRCEFYGGGQSTTRARVPRKDRWIFPLRQDDGRSTILSLHGCPNDRKAKPWAEYREPTWHGRHRWSGGGGDYKRWVEHKRAQEAQR